MAQQLERMLISIETALAAATATGRVHLSPWVDAIYPHIQRLREHANGAVESTGIDGEYFGEAKGLLSSSYNLDEDIPVHLFISNIYIYIFHCI